MKIQTKITKLTVQIIVILFLLGMPIYGSGLNSLLERAADHAREARGWKAGRISMETEVLDGEGRVEKRSTVVMELEEPGGSYRIASITEDGEERRVEKKKKPIAGSMEIDPFFPGDRERVTWRETDSSDTGLFAFTLIQEPEKQDPVRFEGNLLVDEHSGAPIALSYRVVEPPKMIRELKSESIYRPVARASWISLPAETVTDITVKVLFLEKRMRVRTSYEDYRPLRVVSAGERGGER